MYLLNRKASINFNMPSIRHVESPTLTHIREQFIEQQKKQEQHQSEPHHHHHHQHHPKLKREGSVESYTTPYTTSLRQEGNTIEEDEDEVFDSSPTLVLDLPDKSSSPTTSSSSSCSSGMISLLKETNSFLPNSIRLQCNTNSYESIGLGCILHLEGGGAIFILMIFFFLEGL